MSNVKMIRYRTHPEHAEENQRLIRAVFAELAEQRPGGVRYAAFRLEDGVSFVHLVALDGEDNPLPSMPAFQEFQSGIGERVAEGPHPSEATEVGSYGVAFG
ncbi:MAG TPA: hypothetical protein VHZ96_26670 [Frankiaceae bacterium]|jgi:hypothetical protein|nr:hypothetical protein [Frankiaceae bacterium]